MRVTRGLGVRQCSQNEIKSFASELSTYFIHMQYIVVSREPDIVFYCTVLQCYDRKTNLSPKDLARACCIILSNNGPTNSSQADNTTHVLNQPKSLFSIALFYDRMTERQNSVKPFLNSWA